MSSVFILADKRIVPATLSGLQVQS